MEEKDKLVEARIKVHAGYKDLFLFLLDELKDPVKLKELFGEDDFRRRDFIGELSDCLPQKLKFQPNMALGSKIYLDILYMLKEANVKLLNKDKLFQFCLHYLPNILEEMYISNSPVNKQYRLIIYSILSECIKKKDITKNHNYALSLVRYIQIRSGLIDVDVSVFEQVDQVKRRNFKNTVTFFNELFNDAKTTLSGNQSIDNKSIKEDLYYKHKLDELEIM